MPKKNKRKEGKKKKKIYKLEDKTFPTNICPDERNADVNND